MKTTRTSVLFALILVWVITIFVLCILPGDSLPGTFEFEHLDKVAHLAMFCVLGALLWGFLRITLLQTGVFSFLFTTAFCLLYGGVLEWLQGRYFARSSDLYDWIADMVGTLLGILLCFFFKRLQDNRTTRKK